MGHSKQHQNSRDYDQQVVPDDKQDVWQRHCSCCTFYRRCMPILGLLAVSLLAFSMLSWLGTWKFFTRSDDKKSVGYTMTDELFMDGKHSWEMVREAS